MIAHAEQPALASLLSELCRSTSGPASSVRFEMVNDHEAKAVVTHSTAAWLEEILTLDDHALELTEELHQFAAVFGPRANWYEVVPMWVSSKLATVGGWVNSHNSPSCLSQQIQFMPFTDIDGQEMAVLQVHNGTDPGYGYTVPRVFRVPYEDALKEFNVALFLDGDTGLWETNDAGETWTSEAGAVLSNFPPTDDPALRGNGFLFIDENGAGYSPLSGAKLEPCFF